ncbi:Type I Iterative PKS [Paraconiothyrium brasiliense]|uniref:Type I Iterative PKS n=1 Tax=Paraconiothyrium brasiliense TaxID=300254 RepID=A0ABR3R8U7_9PLEO
MVLLLFGDNCFDFHSSIVELYKQSKASVLLRDLLLASSDALQYGLSGLSAAEREYFGPFEGLLELSEHFSRRNDEEQDSAVATVLQRMEMESGSACPITKAHACAGIGTGVLSAVAGASVTSAAALLQVAPAVVSIALRLGIHASRRSRSLEAPSLLSWARQVEGPNVRGRVCSELDAFHTASAIAPHRRLYVGSSAGQNTIIINGPPSVLQLFFDTNARFGTLQTRPLPARAAYHAPHLALPPIDAILGASAFLDLQVPEHTLVLATPPPTALTGPQSVRVVLEQVILETLSSPIDLDALAHALKPFQPLEIGPIGQHISSPLASILRANQSPVPALHSPPACERQTSTSEDIAIVGISGRFPGGDDLEAFWDVLSNGLDLHREIPSNRFELVSHFDPAGSLKNSTSVPYGCFIDHPDLFDAKLFNMSPREAAQTDPIARIFLMTVHEALEMSGYQYDRTSATNHRRIAVYFGQTSDDYREVNASQDVDTFWVTGGIRMFAPGRVNYHYGWEGPGMSVDAACSSSHAAIQLACSALISRECDTAVAGGGMVITNPDGYAGLSRGGFLSKSGPCKPLDSQADGYCRAEAVGTLVLKRLGDAIADRDNIQAVIKSISTNHSAEARSITHPHAGTQERLIRKVLRDGGVEPCDIDYVELHGTGTQAGDLQETTSVANVFGNTRSSNNPLYVGALKANVGHSESASGVSAVIKSILMLQKNTIPRHIGIKTSINPTLPDLQSMNIRIPMDNMSFRQRDGQNNRRRMIVNNFNAAGGNTCLLLEDMPRTITTRSEPRTTQIVTISGRTSKSLTRNLKNMVEYLKTNGNARLCDIAYTTTARRMHHSFRTAHVASSASELVTLLDKEINRTERVISTKAPAAVFVFTGQGSIFAGMGHQLFATSAVFRESIISSDLICRHLGFPSFIKLIQDPDVGLDHYTTVQAQLGQAALEIGLASAWTSWGIKAKAVVGHSLGEYVALCLAEVISVTDMFYLIGHRALLMQANCQQGTHSMLAVAMDEYDTQQTITATGFDSCEIACLNGPTSTTITGPTTELKSLHENLRHRHIKSTMIDVPYAYHSVQVQKFVPDFELIARQVHYGKPKIDVISTLLSRTVRDHGVFGPQYLARQAREPVNFLGAVQSYHELGSAKHDLLWIEIGPRPTCTAMVRSIVKVSPNKLISSMHPNEDQWRTLSVGLAEAYRSGASVDWNQFHKEYEESLQLLDLPKYAFDLQSYWIQYEGDWNRQKSSSIQVAPVAESPFSSTTLQKIESEVSLKGQRTTTFLSDLNEPSLKDTIKGHLVGGCALCPSSVYADMAYSAARYIWKQSYPGQEVPGINVSGMSIHSPIILREESNQQIRVTAVHDEATTRVRVTLGLSSSNDSSAECSVFFEDSEQWGLNWVEQGLFLQSVIDRLTVQGTNNGSTERFLRKTAYRIFSRLVDYAPAYQGIDEVFLDGEKLEGYAKIKLQPKTVGAIFGINPYWIDSLGHLSGFVMHASSDHSQVYISEGWESMRLRAPLSESQTYHAYVRMLPVGGPERVAGNVYILSDSEIVGVFQAVKFRALKEKVLQMVLGVQPARNANASLVNSDKSLQDSSTSSYVSFAPAENIMALVDSCVCSETGVDKNEITEETYLVDLGIDSLLTISLLAKLQEQADLSIPSSDFMAFDTVGDLRRYVSKVTCTPGSTGASTPASPPLYAPKVVTSLSLPTPVPTASPEIVTAYYPLATSVELQKYSDSKATTTPTFFLLPDGSGSASSYLNIKLETSMRIVALSSPFLRDPEAFPADLRPVSQVFVQEILARQPDGDYLLGGWSMGAAYAYEAANLLVALGKQIRGLVMIDPSPLNRRPITTQTLAVLEQVGVLDELGQANEATQAIVRRHFEASTKALANYTPEARRADFRVLIVSASNTVLERLGKNEGQEVWDRYRKDCGDDEAWLLWSREGDTTHGWGCMFDSVVHKEIGGDHFSIMKQAQVCIERVSALRIKRTL